MIINYKSIQDELEENGFETKINDSNKQIVAKKNGATFILNCSKMTWGCPQLRVTGNGIGNMIHVSDNTFTVVKTLTKRKEISIVYSKLGFIQRMLSKKFYNMLIEEFKEK